MGTRHEIPPGDSRVAPLRRLPIAGASISNARPSPLGRLHFRVGELAKRTGKTVRALHLYEEIGLLEPAKRTDAGYRLYSSDSVTRVEWIGRMQEAGLSLPEIRDVLANWGESQSAAHAMKQVYSLFRSKLDETRDQIVRLRELELELAKSLEYLDTCHTCAPEREVSECASCDRHDVDSRTPVLVAGFHSPRADAPAPGNISAPGAGALGATRPSAAVTATPSGRETVERETDSRMPARGAPEIAPPDRT